MTRPRPRLVGVVLLVLVLVVLGSVRPGLLRTLWAEDSSEPKESPVKAVMKTFKSAGKSVSQGLGKGDRTRVLDGAAKLIAAGKELAPLYPVADDESGKQDFAEKSDALAKAAGEFLAAAEKVDFADPKAVAVLREQYLGWVRPTCVACHNVYWVTYRCQSTNEKWTQPKWEPMHCRVCGKSGCGVKLDSDGE